MRLGNCYERIVPFLVGIDWSQSIVAAAMFVLAVGAERLLSEVDCVNRL